jgi:serine/threonine protein kinase
MEVQNYVLPEGTKLDNGTYTILYKIGAGGFGITYLAKNRIGKEVVIKELFLAGHCVRNTTSNTITLQNITSDNFSHIKERFKREGKTLLEFNNHKNIVQAIELFDENDTLYLVMEYIDGQNLDEMVRERETPLSTAEAMPICNEVLDALEAMHKKKFYHRDIKPSNIMFSKSGRIVLIDFGISKQVDDSITVTTQQAFSKYYSPPEQRIEGMKPTAQIDIYSIAATMYFLLTKEKPLDIVQRNMENLRSPREIVSTIAPAIDNAIMRALNLKPQDRFGSVAEFRSAMTAAPVANVQYDDEMTIPIIGNSRPSHASKVVEVTKKKDEEDKPAMLWVAGKWLLRGVAMVFVLLGGIQLGFTAMGEKTSVLKFLRGEQQNPPYVYKDSLNPYTKTIANNDVKPNPNPIVNPAPPIDKPKPVVLNNEKKKIDAKPVNNFIEPKPEPRRNEYVRPEPTPTPQPTTYSTAGVWTGKGASDTGQKWVLRGSDSGGASVEYISFSDGDNEGYIQMNGYWSRSGSSFSNRIGKVDLILNYEGKTIKLRSVEDMSEYNELGEKEKGQLEMILKIFDALEGTTINYRMENLSANRIRLTELSSGEAVYLSK